jgi:hypothetical protein
LETKGLAIKGLACKLIYRYIMVAVVQDEQVKEGELLLPAASRAQVLHPLRQIDRRREVKDQRVLGLDGNGLWSAMT